MSSPRGELSVRSSEDGNVVAVYGPLVIFHLARRMNDRDLALLSGVVDATAGAPSPWGMFMVFARAELAGGIDPKARAFFERLVRQDKQVLEQSALVVTAEGFPGSVIRSIVAGLLQLAGKRTQLEVFPSVPEACQLLARKHQLDALELESAYRQAIAATR